MKSTYPDDRRAGSVADGTNESKSRGKFMVFQESKGQCGWSTEQREDYMRGGKPEVKSSKLFLKRG